MCEPMDCSADRAKHAKTGENLDQNWCGNEDGHRYMVPEHVPTVKG